MRRSTLRVLAAVLLLGSLPMGALADTAPGPRKISYPDEGVEVGTGWNAFEGRKTTGACVAFGVSPGPPPQESSTQIRRVVDKYTFDKAIDISAEMKMQKTLGFGGSAKARYSDNSAVSSDRTNFLLSAWVTNEAEFAVARPGETEIFLLPELAALAVSNPDGFRRRCGDHFVSARWSGAELFGLISFTAQEERTRQAMSAEMEASGFLLSGGGSFSQVLKRYKSSSSQTVSYFQSGGSGEPIPTDEDGFVRAATGLRASAQRAPLHTAIAIRPYSDIKGWPTNGPVPSTPSDYDRLVNRLAEANRLYDNLASIIRNPNGYSVGFPKTLQQLKDWQDAVQLQIAQLTRDLGNCVQRNMRLACGAPITDPEITQGLLDAVNLPVPNAVVVDHYAVPAIGCIPINGPCTLPEPQLDTSYHPTAVANAVYQLRIEEFSRGYCSVDRAHVYCLSNATKKQWREYIFKRLGLPVPSALPMNAALGSDEVPHLQALPPPLRCKHGRCRTR